MRLMRWLLPTLCVLSACAGGGSGGTPADSEPIPVQPAPIAGPTERLTIDEIHRLLEAGPCDIISIGGTNEYDPPDGAPPLYQGYPRIDDGELRYLERDRPMEAYLKPHPAVVIALTGDDVYENEAHDCQRLRTGDEFGPLVGIFPLADAMGEMEIWDQPTAVATIYNWGDFDFSAETYGALEIEDGWNCLWVRRAEVGWRAAVEATDVPCPDATEEPLDYPLFVYVSRLRGERSLEDANSLYPPTGRWAWDDASSAHAIGIRCGAAWCTIGNGRLDVDSIIPSVPGWSDDQFLAIPAAAGSPEPVIPGPRGRVDPDSTYWTVWNGDYVKQFPAELKHEVSLVFMRDQLEQPDGVAIAHISIRDPGDYVDKFSLETTGSFGRSTVFVQGQAPNDLLATFSSSAGEEEGTVTFIHESGHSAAGAVRWRWQEWDEALWASCEEGCCTVER